MFWVGVFVGGGGFMQGRYFMGHLVSELQAAGGAVLPVVQFAVSWGPRVLVSCVAVNNRILVAVLQEGAGSVSLRLADPRDV